MENVVITGIGIISALGIGVESNLDALKKGISGIDKMIYFAPSHKEFPIGEVKYSNLDLINRLKLPESACIPRSSLLGISAAREALSMSNIQDIDNMKLIAGTTVGGMDVIEDVYLDMPTNKESAKNIDYLAAAKSTKMVADYIGIKQRPVTISTACSSALNSIILGTRLIRSGREKAVLAGGNESMSKFHFNGFRSLRIMDIDKCRPFSQDRNGLNLGEGAAYVVLEKESDAKKRGARIIAYVTGFSNKCDAYHQTASSPDGEGAYLAMKEALESAGLKPHDIDYINAHGTGTIDNDKSEFNAIKRLFLNNIPPFSSTKAFTGHTTSAAGSIEAVICLIAMENSFIPANLGWRSPMEGEDIIPSKGCKSRKLSNVMCNSFGFGGNDSSIIFSVAPTNNWQENSKIETEIISGSKLNNEEDLLKIKEYVPSIKARRMGNILKASIITSMDILKSNLPDAIICTTPIGMLENAELLMQDIKLNGDDSPKPTLFMQSTYNTIASCIAIQLGCHCYNITYAENDLEIAMTDAKMLIEEGLAENVLVGYFEENTEVYKNIMKVLGNDKELKTISAQSFIVKKKK